MNRLQRLILDMTLSAISGELKQIPEERLNRWLVHLGKAFGPSHLTHFSELPATDQIDLLERAPVLQTNHVDWIKPFQWVPRRITTWVGRAPELEDIVTSNTQSLKPIPANGEWFILRGYMASTTEEGIHSRLGWRFDDVDFYWTLSVSVKVRD